MRRLWLAIIGIALLCVPTLAQDAALSAMEAKLAEIEARLAELDQQKAELETLKAEVAELQAKGEAPAAPVVAAAKEDTWDYGGFAQVQVQTDQQVAASPQFLVRRVFNAFTWRMGDHTTGKAVINTTPTAIGMLDAWLETKSGDVALRAGQMSMPWGYDLNESSSVRTVFEYDRALISMFPGAYEIGARVQTNPGDTHGTSLSLGVYNGNGPNVVDNNASKDILVEARQYFDEGKGSVYAAANFGAYTTAGGTAFPRRYYGAGARHNGNHFELQGEAQFGQGHTLYAAATPFVGGYGQVGYRTGKNLLYTRYSYFDRNSNVANDTYAAPTVGYTYNFNSRNKVSAELNLINDQATVGGDTRFGVRWQTKW